MKSQTSRITVAIPKRLLLKAKKMAEERGVSLSKLLVDLLVRMVDQHRAYQEAKRKSLALLRRLRATGDAGKRATASERR